MTVQVAAQSLRERKKLATRRELRRIALDLVARHGFVNVTVEDIAAAADVSPRTFFNYFPTKEAALFGMDPDRVAALREAIATTAPGAPALTAMREVMVGVARGMTEDLMALGGEPADWLLRLKAARSDPHVRAAQAAQMAQLERTLAEGLGRRLGTDPEHDPYPGLLAAVAAATVRSGVIFWSNSGGDMALDQYVDLAFRALADGLPEQSGLRRVSGTADAQEGEGD
ncbi:MAG TPA: TetR family transcriptional regulator [Trebonia sp.]|jgi:AcrR family transcriptional regulator|nr:TetR family transcriptional regulator [Trebonia sp.]